MKIIVRQREREREFPHGLGVARRAKGGRYKLLHKIFQIIR